MKTESQIKQKLKQVVFRHRKTEIEKALSVRPCNCIHNQIEDFKGPNILHQIRICTYKSEKVNFERKLCDPSFDGLRQAQKCKYFQCKNTSEQIGKEFDRKIGVDGSPIDKEKVALEYPDVMALYWCLSNSDDPMKPEQSKKKEHISVNPEFLLAFSQIGEDHCE